MAQDQISKLDHFNFHTDSAHEDSDAELIRKTETLVREERELLTAILHCFREIERRRLFSAMGYRSLFECAVKHFGYSEDQAYRRISAMRLLRELPEIEGKIASGEVTLTHLSLARSLFQQEAKARNEMPIPRKIEIISAMAQKTTREAERVAMSFSSAPAPARREMIKAVTAETIELRFNASPEIEKKIETLKGYLAHTNPHLTLGELFEKLCDLGLKEWDPSSPAAPRKRRIIESSKANARRTVFARAGNKCERCGSRHALEIDHVKPRALGSTDDGENLRVLCRACNQRAAIETLGLEQMTIFLE